jgi:hypothetical protein
VQFQLVQDFFLSIEPNVECELNLNLFLCRRYPFRAELFSVSTLLPLPAPLLQDFIFYYGFRTHFPLICKIQSNSHCLFLFSHILPFTLTPPSSSTYSPSCTSPTHTAFPSILFLSLSPIPPPTLTPPSSSTFSSFLYFSYSSFYFSPLYSSFFFLLFLFTSCILLPFFLLTTPLHPPPSFSYSSSSYSFFLRNFFLNSPFHPPFSLLTPPLTIPSPLP